jgi:hypothetical protein
MPDILQSLEGVVVRPALASDKAAVLQCMPAYLARYRRLHRLGLGQVDGRCFRSDLGSPVK